LVFLQQRNRTAKYLYLELSIRRDLGADHLDFSGPSAAIELARVISEVLDPVKGAPQFRHR
jgi:hypothetical protein